MNKYRVSVREVHIQGYLVDAENEEEAKDKVYHRHCDAQVDEESFEYSHDLDRNLWTVETVVTEKEA